MHRHLSHCSKHRGERGGRGSKSFGGRFAERGELGGRGFGMGRKLSSDDLQLLILGLLDEKPSYGYEIIAALDERSKGFYAPSPGMVYPALTALEDIGHASVEAEGARKRYRLTDLGTSHLKEHKSRADALFAQFAQVGERMEHLRRAMSHEESAEDDALMRARRALKSALIAKHDSPAEEQERIALILQRAAEEISGKAAG
jgi:DNA-binding PadR family transcriptional regulator